MDLMSSADLRPPASAKRQRRASPTTIDALGDDALCLIFAFLDLVHLIRCSAVCKPWRTVINKLKLLQIQYHRQRQTDSPSVSDLSNYSDKMINLQMEQLAIDRQRSSLHEGPANIFQLKAHSVGFNKCRMKMGLILTGAGDKVMRLWSAESCKRLDEYHLPDRAPLIDFDFDEGKIVGLVGTRICIWRRTGTRDLFSSRDGLFTRGSCMCYVDPQAVVGCEDGKVRVFDMYSRKISQIIKMHPGAVSSLCFSDEQLIVSGSSLGSISISDLSSDQRVVTLDTTGYAGIIKTLCLNPSSFSLFAGSSTGHVSCWDLRTLRRRWETRVSPNVLYSMHHLRNDASTLVIGGIDGVLRIVDQGSGHVLSRCIMENSSVSNRSIEKKKGIRLEEDVRVDLLPTRPPITCLAVGMQKVVTAQSDRCLRVWKFVKFPKYIQASISVGTILLRRFPKSRPSPNLVPPRNPNNGVHPEGDRRRSAGDAGVQSVLPAGELSDEVLLLPHPLMAAAPLCRRGLQRQDCRLCSRQDGGGNHRVPRPHHLPRRPQNSPQTRPRHQTHDCCSERHGTGVWGRVCFTAC